MTNEILKKLNIDAILLVLTLQAEIPKQFTKTSENLKLDHILSPIPVNSAVNFLSEVI